MPVQTQILTRRGTAASWTSTNPTLGAGEIGYETDTGRFKIGTGAAAWASLGYFNRDPLTTKGDLYTFSTTDDRLAVGSNGETLVADSSTSTGLRYTSNFAAGKNKIINGDFGVWQRGTTIGPVINPGFLADRFNCQQVGESATYSQQTFTPGAAPVAGYESQYFARVASTTVASASAYTLFEQRIEDVRTFAGQTMTFSFYAKADATKSISIEVGQVFGGSGTVLINVGKQALSTSWARYTFTISIPSISGKTIGTGSYLNFRCWLSAGSNFDARTGTLGQQSITFDTWGWQAEYGSVATAFQTATGTLQGELAACQRYYWRAGGNAIYQAFGNGIATIATSAQVVVTNPVSMRAVPTSHAVSTVGLTDTLTTVAVTSSVIGQAGINQNLFVLGTASGLTQFRPYILNANNSTNAYIEVSAEL